MIKETFDKFAALMEGVNNDAVKDAFLNFQKSLEYCIEENTVMREVLRDKYKCKKLPLNDEQKKRLAVKAINLNKHILEDVVKIFQPATVLSWHRDLVGKKYDSSGTPNGAKRGPKMVPPEVIAEVLKLARRNPEWGYERIASCMEYLGFKISKSTVKRILVDNGISRDPETKKHIDWELFISSHKDVLATTDFFTAEVLTEYGLQRYMVIFTSEEQLRYAIKSYIYFYHHLRPHGGLGGRMIEPLPQDEDGEIVEFNYLGGLLRGYRRVKRTA